MAPSRRTLKRFSYIALFSGVGCLRIASKAVVRARLQDRRIKICWAQVETRPPYKASTPTPAPKAGAVWSRGREKG